MHSKKIISLMLVAFFCVQVPFAAAAFRGRNIIFEETQKLSPNGLLTLNLKLPPNHHFAADIESTFKIFVRDAASLQFEPSQKKTDLSLDKAALKFSYKGNVTQTIVVIEARIYFCDDIHKVCIADLLRIKFRAEINAHANPDFQITVPVSRTRRK